VSDAATPYTGGHDERDPERGVGEGGHSAVEAEVASPRVPAPSGREVARPDVPDPVARSGSAATKPHHVCSPPAIGGGTIPQQPDWTCAACGRIWRDMRTGVGTQWWAEVRGPTHFPRGETL